MTARCFDARHGATVHCAECDRDACRQCGEEDTRASRYVIDIGASCGRCAPPSYDVPRPDLEQRPSGLWVPEDVAREIER